MLPTSTLIIDQIPQSYSATRISECPRILLDGLSLPQHGDIVPINIALLKTTASRIVLHTIPIFWSLEFLPQLPQKVVHLAKALKSQFQLLHSEMPDKNLDLTDTISILSTKIQENTQEAKHLAWVGSTTKKIILNTEAMPMRNFIQPVILVPSMKVKSYIFSPLSAWIK